MRITGAAAEPRLASTLNCNVPALMVTPLTASLSVPKVLVPLRISRP